MAAAALSPPLALRPARAPAPDPQRRRAPSVAHPGGRTSPAGLRVRVGPRPVAAAGREGDHKDWQYSSDKADESERPELTRRMAASGAEGEDGGLLDARMHALLQAPCAEAMSTPVITLGPMATLGEAMEIFTTRRISACPVLGEGSPPPLLGIITETDILQAAAMISSPEGDYILPEGVFGGQHGCATIPVVHPKEGLVGIISRWDVMRWTMGPKCPPVDPATARPNLSDPQPEDEEYDTVAEEYDTVEEIEGSEL